MTCSTSPYRLVLLRHGESEWNRTGQVTGWVDVGPLGARRRAVAVDRPAARRLRTSLLTRAIQSTQWSCRPPGAAGFPVRRSWRLNERHYGALQGKCGQQTRHEFGDAQYMLWRSSCDVPTPPLDTDSEWATGADPRYRDLTPDVLPGAECLKDVLERLLPYWRDPMVPNLCTHGAELDARLRRSAQTLGRTAGVPG